jgi:long-chain acyl-CoA synthetase
VIGVPDERTGQAVVAYVRAAPGDTEEREALADAVRDHCARTLARFKQPTRIEVVDALPLTVTGKVARGRLRATVRRQNLGLLE